MRFANVRTDFSPSSSVSTKSPQGIWKKPVKHGIQRSTTIRSCCPSEPKVQLSKLVNSLKGVSARLLRKGYDAHVRRYLWGGHFWSGSYFAGSCDGAPLTDVKQYREPEAPHGPR
jgi:hypothetical protein